MKIVIPLLEFGRSGGYRVLSQLANEWVALGHNVIFVVPECSEAPYYPTSAKISRITRSGIFTNLASPETKGFRGVLVRLVAIYKGLKTESNCTDVILANHNLTVWPVVFVKSEAQKVYYIQAYEPEYYHEHTIKKYILKVAAFLSYYAISKKISNAPIYLKYKNLKSENWVPPGVDFSLFYPNKSNEQNNTIFRIGCIGRKEIEKGIYYVIEAFLLLRDKGVPVSLNIAFGNVSEKISTMEDVNIIFPNGDKELGDFYRSLDALIAPGLVQLGAAHYPVMEAMACGIPVVTTGYIPANQENAWIVPTSDTLAIANAIEKIMSSNREIIKSKTELGLKAIEEFSWKNVSTKFIKLLEHT